MQSRRLLLAALCALGVGMPARLNAQPSGAVQRNLQDEQIRDALQDLQEQELRQDQRRLIEGVPTDQSPSSGTDQGQAPPVEGERIRQVVIRGGEFLSPKFVDGLRAKYLGRPADQASLDGLRGEVEREYRRMNYLAVVGQPAEIEGKVTIPVVVATLDAVRIESNTAPIPDKWAIQTVTDSIPLGDPIRLTKLESAMLKLNDLGAVKAKARVGQGSEPGSSQVLLRLEKQDQVMGAVALNNYVIQFTGSYQVQPNVTFLGLMGRGEKVNVSGAYSGNIDWYGSRQIAFMAEYPLTPDGLGFLGNYSYSDYRLLQDLTVDNYLGEFQSGSVGLSQVLWRRPKTNLSVRVVGELNQFEDSVLDFTYSDRHNLLGRVSLLGDHQDSWFNGIGLNNALFSASVGSLSHYAEGEPEFDDLTIDAGGVWGKLNLLYNRYQMFKSSQFSMEFLGQGQLAFNNLDSAQKMSLGWPLGVRAYPPGEAAGDSGVSAQLTGRYQVAANVSFRGYVDGGYIWRWTNAWIGMPNLNSLGLWGPGIGVDWGTRGDLLLGADLAFPVGNNPYGVNGLDIDGENPSARFWISLRKWL